MNTSKLLVISIGTVLSGCNSFPSQPRTPLIDDLLIHCVAIEDSLVNRNALYERDEIASAYVAKDTSYLIEKLEDLKANLDYEANSKTKRILVPLGKQEIKYEDVYQFRFDQSFCDQIIEVTIGRKGDSSEIVRKTYQILFDSARPRLIQLKTDTIGLPIQKWYEFVQLITYSDFWRASSHGDEGLDGNSISISAISISSYRRTEKKITRWGAEATVWGDLMRRVLVISKVRSHCLSAFGKEFSG